MSESEDDTDLCCNLYPQITVMLLYWFVSIIKFPGFWWCISDSMVFIHDAFNSHVNFTLSFLLFSVCVDAVL